jgi:hypothetical protein
MNKSSNITGMIVALVAGLIIGWVIKGVMPVNTLTAGNVATSAPVQMNFDSKSASDLRNNLNSLLREHTITGALYLSGLYGGADVSAFDKYMTNNTNNLVLVVNNVYGKATADEFKSLWMQHMDEYKNYTLAKKANDPAKMTSAKNNLKDIAAKIGTLFSKGGGNLKAADVTKLINDHVNGTLAIVDSVATVNIGKSIDLMKTGYDQAGLIADTLANGMIKDKPDMFK